MGELLILTSPKRNFRQCDSTASAIRFDLSVPAVDERGLRLHLNPGANTHGNMSMNEATIGHAVAILEADFIALVIVRDRHIVWANGAMHRIFGFEPNELTGQPTRTLFLDDDSYAAFGQALYAAIREDRPFTTTIPQRLKDGTTGWYEFNVSRLPGDPDAVIGTIVDRTAGHRALEEREVLAQILSSIGDSVSIVAADGTIRYTNAAFDVMFGYAKGELIGRHVAVVNDGPDATAREVAADIMAALVLQGTWQGDLRNRRKDGSTFWSNASISRHQTPQWGPVWISVQRDITERRRLQEHLEASEARFRAVVEDQTEVISRFAPDGTFVFVNDVFCRLFGKSADELLGHRWHPAAHPDDLPGIEARLRELSPTNPVVIVENRVLAAGDATRWMQFVNRGFFDAAGTLVEIQAVGRDITDLKRVEADLRRNEERLALALAASGLSFWDWDVAAHRVTADRRWLDTLGYTVEDLGADEANWLRLIDPRDRARFDDALQAHMQGDSAAFFSEHRLRHHDGRWIYVEAFGKVCARDEAGTPLRMVGTLRDITDRKNVASAGEELLRKFEALVTRMAAPAHADGSDQAVTGAAPRLSARNREILALLAEGLTTAEIAIRLGIAESTAKTHRHNLMRKLGLRNKAELIRFALEHNIRALDSR